MARFNNSFTSTVSQQSTVSPPSNLRPNGQTIMDNNSQLGQTASSLASNGQTTMTANAQSIMDSAQITAKLQNLLTQASDLQTADFVAGCVDILYIDPSWLQDAAPSMKRLHFSHKNLLLEKFGNNIPIRRVQEMKILEACIYHAEYQKHRLDFTQQALSSHREYRNAHRHQNSNNMAEIHKGITNTRANALAAISEAQNFYRSQDSAQVDVSYSPHGYQLQHQQTHQQGFQNPPLVPAPQLEQQTLQQPVQPNGVPSPYFGLPQTGNQVPQSPIISQPGLQDLQDAGFSLPGHGIPEQPIEQGFQSRSFAPQPGPSNMMPQGYSLPPNQNMAPSNHQLNMALQGHPFWWNFDGRLLLVQAVLPQPVYAPQRPQRRGPIDLTVVDDAAAPPTTSTNAEQPHPNFPCQVQQLGPAPENKRKASNAVHGSVPKRSKTTNPAKPAKQPKSRKTPQPEPPQESILYEDEQAWQADSEARLLAEKTFILERAFAENKLLSTESAVPTLEETEAGWLATPVEEQPPADTEPWPATGGEQTPATADVDSSAQQTNAQNQARAEPEPVVDADLDNLFGNNLSGNDLFANDLFGDDHFADLPPFGDDNPDFSYFDNATL